MEPEQAGPDLRRPPSPESSPPSGEAGERPLPSPAGLLDRQFLARRCDEHRRRGERIVFTNGCFDLLHAGHVLYLEEARRLGDRLVVGLNSDASVTRLKGRGRPLEPEGARAIVLLGLKSVDYVSIFEEDTPLELIRAVRPDVLCKGGDYVPETVVGRDFVEGYGGRLVLLRYHPGLSTSQLVERLSRRLQSPE